LADERRAARIAVLVGGGRVEVGGWFPEAGQWAVEGRATGAGAGAGTAMQRTRKDRVTGPRSWTSLTMTARTLSRSFMRLALVLAALADLRCKFLSWRCVRCQCQVNRQVSEPLLVELRAPLVRPLELLQVGEPAPRLVPLNLLLELRVQLILLDRTPLYSEAACWPFARAEKLFWVRLTWFRINLGDLTPAVLFQVAEVGVGSSSKLWPIAAKWFGRVFCSCVRWCGGSCVVCVVRVTCVL